MPEQTIAPIDPTTVVPIATAPIPPVPTTPVAPSSPPTVLPMTPKKSPIIPILISLLILGLLAFVGYFYWQNMQLKQQLTTAPSPTASTDPTANWKTYTTSKGDFSFKYPTDIYPIEMDANHPYFYSTEEEGIAARDCLTYQKGTIENPCNPGLFSVYPTKTLDTLEGSTNTLETYMFTDPQNRRWFVVAPVYGLGGTSTNAETINNGTNYRVQIQIHDSYIVGQTEVDLEKQKTFINQILSTFKFTN